MPPNLGIDYEWPVRALLAVEWMRLNHIPCRVSSAIDYNGSRYESQRNQGQFVILVSHRHFERLSAQERYASALGDYSRLEKERRSLEAASSGKSDDHPTVKMLREVGAKVEALKATMDELDELRARKETVHEFGPEVFES